MNEANQPAAPKQFKSQPWVLFDTVVAKSYLLGDTSANGLAVGTQTPAINAQGEMVFFGQSGRTQANYPWYTNMDTAGQLAYGMEVWQVYLLFAFPAAPLIANNTYNAPAAVPNALLPPPTTRLLECLVNFGVLEFTLGQESQFSFPVSRFGAGGGVKDNANATSLPSNADQQAANVLKFPEPIEMPRTQNLSAKLRLASEVLALIGTVAAPGVGAPLPNVSYTIATVATALTLQPYATQLGFVGRRVKKTQYGQLPDNG